MIDKLIDQVDPEGDRTIGVLTKPDLIGPGNEDEAAAVLKNVRKPLKLGYVMVKCRSQRDIEQGSCQKLGYSRRDTQKGG